MTIHYLDINGFKYPMDSRNADIYINRPDLPKVPFWHPVSTMGEWKNPFNEEVKDLSLDGIYREHILRRLSEPRVIKIIGDGTYDELKTNDISVNDLLQKIKKHGGSDLRNDIIKTFEEYCWFYHKDSLDSTEVLPKKNMKDHTIKGTHKCGLQWSDFNIAKHWLNKEFCMDVAKIPYTHEETEELENKWPYIDWHFWVGIDEYPCISREGVVKINEGARPMDRPGLMLSLCWEELKLKDIGEEEYFKKACEKLQIPNSTKTRKSLRNLQKSIIALDYLQPS